MHVALEFLVFAGTIVALSVVRFFAPQAFRAGRRRLVAFANRRWLATAAVAALAFFGSVSLSVLLEIPEPRVHDEFSYLLGADTFAAGRLTNPSSPLWASFETFHVNQQPSYHSMYPPAQGAVLALGQVIAGMPIAGVWLSMSAACAAMCWMLQSWLPPRWAFLGAVIGTIRLVFAARAVGGVSDLGYWSHSYWGGAVATLGGALVFGAVGRLSQRPTAASSAVLSVGCAILANSRPFEGFVAILFGLAVLVRRAWPYRHVVSRAAAQKTILPAIAVMIPAAGFMAYYNYATTGQPMMRPYEANMATYWTVPLSLLQELRPQPEYHHDVMRRFYADWAQSRFYRQRQLTGFLAEGGSRLQTLWLFFCGPLIAIPLLAALCTLRCGGTKVALCGCLVVVWALAHMTWCEPHYLAPVAGLFYLLVAQGARYLAAARWLRASLGPVFASALVAALCAVTLVQIKVASGVDRSGSWHLQRAELREELLRLGGRHLLFVHYAPEHSPHEEWVYNAADIEDSSIVWVRESDDEQMRRMIERFSNWHIWRLRVLDSQFELSPFSNSEHKCKFIVD